MKKEKKHNPPQINKTNARAFQLMLKRRSVQRVVAFLHNEWLRQYIEKSETFRQLSDIAAQFGQQQTKGLMPSHGQECVGMLLALLDQLTAPKRPTRVRALASSHRKPTPTKKAPKRQAVSRKPIGAWGLSYD